MHTCPNCNEDIDVNTNTEHQEVNNLVGETFCSMICSTDYTRGTMLLTYARAMYNQSSPVTHKKVIDQFLTEGLYESDINDLHKVLGVNTCKQCSTGIKPHSKTIANGIFHKDGDIFCSKMCSLTYTEQNIHLAYSRTLTANVASKYHNEAIGTLRSLGVSDELLTRLKVDLGES